MRISNKLRKEREAAEKEVDIDGGKNGKKPKKNKVDWSKANKDNIPVCDIELEESALNDITEEAIED